MSDTRGRFLWYELMTTDPAGALRFYTDTVGWGTETWEGGEEPYTMFTNGETPVAGVMRLPEEAQAQGAPPHWIPYVGSPECDATCERAKELGATALVEPMSIPEVGRFAVLCDPQGATFAIYTPEREMPEGDAPPQPGQFSWHELATTDPDAAWDFYTDLFGWVKTEEMDMGDAGVYRMYGRPGSQVPLGGVFRKPEEMPGPAAWLCYAMVDDVYPTTEKVSAGGGQVLHGPMEVPGGDIVATCMDPQGATFAVHAAARSLTPGNGK